MNVFDLAATLTLDSSQYEQSLDEASSSGTSKLGGMMKSFSKVSAVALGAASTAVVKLGKDAISAYADYEQLVGGVETLFKDSADVVQEYAANAYKTAGLSANEYMETVTSFSASLLQSVDGDTQKAAEKANLAITDMSDNANKMGTSMESIQNAYQGFAKANYTMLDNLKLGYGGTKEEMERLLKDASEISGIEYDISSYADIVDAIHVIQTEMDITGTTAKEASTTISGSLSSMKSAWQNMLTGIADENADFPTLMQNFVDSVVTVGENLIPRIQQVLQGLGTLIQSAADTILPMVIETIIDNLPQMIESGVSMIVSLVAGLVSAIPQLVEAIPEIIKAIVNAFKASAPKLKQAGKDIIEMLKNLFNNLLNTAKDWGKDMIQNFIDGITEKWQALKDKVSGVAQTVKDFLGFSEPDKGPLSNFHTYAPDMMELFAKGIKDNEGVVTSQIAKSFDFGTIGAGSTGEYGGIASTARDIVINITSEIDGKVLARNQYSYNQNEIKRHGASLVGGA